MIGGTINLEKLSVCECDKCVSKRPVKSSFEMPDPSEGPLRVRLVTTNLKTGKSVAFTNRGKVARESAVRATTKRLMTVEFVDIFDGIKTVSLMNPGEKMLRLAS